MQWFSMDQKPSWFNNAAATGTFGRKGQPVTVREKFAASRERYTINTTVQTYTYEGLAATTVENEAPVLIDSDDEEPGSQPPPSKPKMPSMVDSESIILLSDKARAARERARASSTRERARAR